MIFGNLASCQNGEEKVDKSKLTGYGYRLFENTPIWPLAKAVKEGDIFKIKAEVVENKIDPNYQELRYGNTLLIMSILNNDYASAKALLDAGADPDLKDKHRGANAVIDAAGKSDPKYLKLLLAYKGNPNVVENKLVKDDDSPLQTAVTSAISYSDPNSLKKVELLIEAGADVNYPADKNNNTDLPLGKALLQNKMDVALYLLKKGADYRRAMYRTINNQDIYILKALRKIILDLQSSEYQKKLAVVAFLKSKGLDYYREPIPDFILKEIKKKYPKNWEEFARKY